MTRAGNDVRDNSRIPYEWTLDQTRILEQESPKCVPHRLSRRMLADGSFEALQTDEEERPETELDSPVPKGTLPAPTEDRNARQRSFLEQLDPWSSSIRIWADTGFCLTMSQTEVIRWTNSWIS